VVSIPLYQRISPVPTASGTLFQERLAGTRRHSHQCGGHSPSRAIPWRRRIPHYII